MRNTCRHWILNTIDTVPPTAEIRQRAHRATADGARNNYGRTGPLQQTAPAFNPAVSPSCRPA